MHEPEKSDSVVVAEKPTNKAERSVAEPVEPRTENKGNAGQQSTRRAQDRASVSQALERLRQAARQRKKERFTSLLHHVDCAMLRTAVYAMKRDSAPGVVERTVFFIPAGQLRFSAGMNGAEDMIVDHNMVVTQVFDRLGKRLDRPCIAAKFDL